MLPFTPSRKFMYLLPQLASEMTPMRSDKYLLELNTWKTLQSMNTFGHVLEFLSPPSISKESKTIEFSRLFLEIGDSLFKFFTSMRSDLLVKVKFRWNVVDFCSYRTNSSSSWCCDCQALWIGVWIYWISHWSNDCYGYYWRKLWKFFRHHCNCLAFDLFVVTYLTLF